MTDRLHLRLPAAPTAVTVERWTEPSGQDGLGADPRAAGLAELEQQRRLAAERDQLNKALAALEDGLAELSALREQIVREAELQLLELAVDIARKVLMQEIQAGRYEIEPIVKEALGQVASGKDVVAHLHPDDWASCQRARPGMGDSAESGGIRFVADPGVRRAECVLETSEGVVASSVDDSLRGISRALGSAE